MIEFVYKKIRKWKFEYYGKTNHMHVPVKGILPLGFSDGSEMAVCGKCYRSIERDSDKLPWRLYENEQ